MKKHKCRFTLAKPNPSILQTPRKPDPLPKKAQSNKHKVRRAMITIFNRKTEERIRICVQEEAIGKTKSGNYKFAHNGHIVFSKDRQYFEGAWDED